MPVSKKRKKPQQRTKPRRHRMKYPWNPYCLMRLYRISTPTRLVFTRNLDMVKREKDRAIDDLDVRAVHQCQWIEATLYAYRIWEERRNYAKAVDDMRKVVLG